MFHLSIWREGTLTYTTPSSPESQTVFPHQYILPFRRRTSRNMIYGVPSLSKYDVKIVLVIHKNGKVSANYL